MDYFHPLYCTPATNKIRHACYKWCTNGATKEIKNNYYYYLEEEEEGRVGGGKEEKKRKKKHGQVFVQIRIVMLNRVGNNNLTRTTILAMPFYALQCCQASNRTAFLMCNIEQAAKEIE